MPQTVREVMTVDPIVLESTEAVSIAAKKMKEADVGDVLVEDNGRLRGILTDRDIVVRVIAEDLDPDNVTVGKVASSDLQAVSPDDAVATVINEMRQDAIRRVPVVEDGTAVGILSIGDLAVERDAKSALADISAASPNA